MKTNKFLGLVGTAVTALALWSVACASPTTRTVGGDNEPSKTEDESPSKSSASNTTTTPSTSTATTTGTTTNVKDSGAVTPPTVDSCSLLATCANTRDNDYEAAAWLITATLVKDQTACAAGLIACKTGIIGDIFAGSCDKLSDCCDEMSSNGNSGSANACRSTSNAGDTDACQSQLNSYTSQGLCSN